VRLQTLPDSIPKAYRWSPDLAVGIPRMDEEHKWMFEGGEAVYLALARNQHPDEVDRLFKDLIERAVTHFTHEEELMKQAEYPKMGSHRQQHRALFLQVQDMQAKIHRGGAIITLEVFTMLSKWLTEHVRNSDIHLARFLKAHQPQP
jgi:hemerythrin-like metal-binding protein